MLPLADSPKTAHRWLVFDEIQQLLDVKVTFVVGMREQEFLVRDPLLASNSDASDAAFILSSSFLIFSRT